MGWFILIVLALLTFAALWPWMRRDIGAMQFLLAALLLALAGYAWQGRPALDGRPRSAEAREALPDTAFAQTREAMFGRFSRAWGWFNLADSYHRRGDTAGAAQLLWSALRQAPNDSALWTGYGYALFLHGDGLMSPAASFAFVRARTLAPDHPGPSFYYGLALAQSGQLDEAERIWTALLRSGPEGGEWREVVETSLAFLAQARAAQRGAPPQPPAP